MSKSLAEIESSTVTAPPAAGGIPSLPPNPEPLSPARRAWVENVTILLNHKWLILSVTVVVTIAVGIYVFIAMPNYYKARAVILPARRAGGALDNITSGISNSLKDIGLAKLNGGEESYTPLSLMQSRELKEKIVRQFNFVSIYQVKNVSDAVDQFSGNLDGELTEEGNFIVSFEDTDPKRAAVVTNAVVDGINEVNSRLAKDEALHNFSATEARYQKNVGDLDSAEHALGMFQKQYGVYLLPEQAKAELSALAELEQEKYAAQIQLQNAEQLYGSNASEVTTLRNTVEQLASKLAEMQTGLDVKASSFVPSNVMPDVALQYLRLMREVEIQSKLKAFLLPAYEQAKLDEDRNLYGFVTLDHAEVPVKKSRPHRSTLLLGTLFGTALIISVLILFLTNTRSLRSRFKLDQKQLFA